MHRPIGSSLRKGSDTCLMMVDGEIVCRDGVIVKMPDHGRSSASADDRQTHAERRGAATRLEPAWRLHNIGR